MVLVDSKMGTPQDRYILQILSVYGYHRRKYNNFYKNKKYLGFSVSVIEIT